MYNMRDVETANVVVRPDESVVLFDFEWSVLNADGMMLMKEEDEVLHMLQIAKNRARELMSAYDKVSFKIKTTSTYIYQNKRSIILEMRRGY